MGTIALQLRPVKKIEDESVSQPHSRSKVLDIISAC
jgi:hypothetical protein